MRSQTIPTNLSCNQNCTYCLARRPSDDRAFIVGSAVRQRIDAAFADHAEEIIFSGGEPTMRSDLEKLIAYAASRGAKSITLETNATLIDATRAAALAASGLSLVRVNVSGFGERLDTMTRQPGGYQAALAGLRALRLTPLPIEISVAVVRSTISQLAELPLRLQADLGGLAGIRALVVRVPIESPDPDELVSYDEAAAAILGLDAAARRAKIPVRLAPESGPPPCAFPGPAASMFSLSPGAPRLPNHVHLEPCARCSIQDRCSGLPEKHLERFAPPSMRPVTEDRFRRRLSLAGTVEQQIERELVRTNRRRESGSSQVFDGQPRGLHVPSVLDERLIRVNFQCNQACRFCFVPTHLPPAGDQAVRDAILSAAKGGARVTLTGGEPTLNANLVEYIRLAKANSQLPVGLQTNAIRLADAAYTASLVEAGLDEVAVSLHGSTAEISDAITEAPGTFERTVIGLDHVHATGLPLDLTFVICARNTHDMVPYVRMVAARWPRAFVNIAFVAPSSDLVPRDAALVPRYSDVMPQLAAAVLEARQLGLKTGGYESMCGLPLCVLPKEIAAYNEFVLDTDGYENGSFVKADACRSCEMESRCYGLRKGYFEMYGAGELHPLRLADPGLAPASSPASRTA